MYTEDEQRVRVGPRRSSVASQEGPPTAARPSAGEGPDVRSLVELIQKVCLSLPSCLILLANAFINLVALDKCLLLPNVCLLL